MRRKVFEILTILRNFKIYKLVFSVLCCSGWLWRSSKREPEESTEVLENNFSRVWNVVEMHHKTLAVSQTGLWSIVLAGPFLAGCKDRRFQKEHFRLQPRPTAEDELYRNLQMITHNYNKRYYKFLYVFTEATRILMAERRGNGICSNTTDTIEWHIVRNDLYT